MSLNIAEIRSHFPSLEGGAVHLDNPAGTQVPHEVMKAVNDYFRASNANAHGVFRTSQSTESAISEARMGMADLLNSRSPAEIVFGPNMTNLTFNISRVLARELAPGQEILVTRLDHDANIAPWEALRDKGVTVTHVDIHAEDCTLDMQDYARRLNEKTRIVAVGYASNATGTINQLARIIRQAHDVGARVFVDAVHYAPHGTIDVQALECDFLVCSVYKFYGPHVGVLYGRYEILDELRPYKVRPAPSQPPEKFEGGTQNHEGLAGVRAAVDYLASVGEKYGDEFKPEFPAFTGRRLNLKTSLAAIRQYERELGRRLLTGLREIPGVKIYGIDDPARADERTPTFAFTLKGCTPRYVSERMAQEDIYLWDGNHYALTLTERLGLDEAGGTIRVGLAHYNTSDEVEKFLAVLSRIQRELPPLRGN